jgi:hypothetical protein
MKLEHKILIVDFSYFHSLNIIIPSEQRLVDQNNVDSIVKYQLEYYNNHNEFNFIGVINIHYCKEHNSYYLVDGQHRYKAMDILSKTHTVSSYIELIKVEFWEDVLNNFKIINKNTPLLDLENVQFCKNKNILDECKAHFQSKYKPLFSTTDKTYRPFVNFNMFIKSISYICSKLNLIDSKTLINLIESKNMLMKEEIRRDKSLSVNMRNKANNHNFYMGTQKLNKNSDYGYDWADEIVVKKENEKKKKKKVPKTVKNISWDKYIGSEIGKVLCI